MSEDIRSPQSVNNEDTRVGGGMIARRCACRGWLVAPESPSKYANAYAEVGEAVQKHQLDEPHKSWDRTAWVNANTTQTVVRVVAKRKAA